MKETIADAPEQDPHPLINGRRLDLGIIAAKGSSESTTSKTSGPLEKTRPIDKMELGEAKLLDLTQDDVAPAGERWVEPIGTGSCFAISPQGHLLTNKHVIDDITKLKRSPKVKKLLDERSMVIVPKVWVFLNRKRYEATILHVDEDYDFSVLKIDHDTASYFRLSSAE